MEGRELPGRHVVDEAIAADDLERLRVLPVDLSLHHPDVDWVADVCLRLANHPDATVRGNAVLGFGHLARRFGRLDSGIREVIERALVDPDAHVRGHAWSAADDTRHFLNWTFGVGTHVERVLWSGRARGRQWRARQVDWWPPGLDAGDTWSLVIETTDGPPEEKLSSWWSPDERVLGGTLRGWSTSAIGNLKRTLAQSPPPGADQGSP
ncbi:MAG: hypothetical protein AAGH15_16980 [Myxococcota bacterium]